MSIRAGIILKGCITVALLSGYFSSLKAQISSEYQYELETPEWYIPTAAGVNELPTGEILLTYLGGAQVYDGGQWNQINDLNGVNILTIETYKGEVWVGLDYDFGKLISDSRGKWRYKSMRHILPDSIKIQNQIIGLYAAKNNLFISTFHDNYIWNGEKIQAYSSQAILNQVQAKQTPGLQTPLLNMTHVVDDRFIQDVEPFGYVAYINGAFVKDTVITKGLSAFILDIVDIGNGELLAPTLNGVFKYSHNTWSKFDVDIPEGDDSRFYVQINVLDDTHFVFFSENYTYIVNRTGEITYTSQNIGKLHHEESFNSGIVTKDGVIWQVGDEGILRIYPKLPTREFECPGYTYTRFGNIFAWDNNELIVSRFSGGAERFKKQKTRNGFNLQSTFSYKKGAGSVLGVYLQNNHLFIPHEHQMFEYKGNSLVSSIEFEPTVNNFFPLKNHPNMFLVSMRGGLGMLTKDSGYNWKQQSIFEDSDYANTIRIIPIGKNKYVGATGNGWIFEVKIPREGLPQITPVVDLRATLSLQQIHEIAFIDSQLVVFSNKGIFKNGTTLHQWVKEPALSQIPAQTVIQKILSQNNTTYIFGYDNWGSKLWRYKNNALTAIPLNAKYFVYNAAVAPDNELWFSRSPTNIKMNADEMLQWYKQQNIRLLIWAEHFGMLSNAKAAQITLPHQYRNLVLHAGFNSHYFSTFNKFRFRINDTAWSKWQSSPEFDFSYLQSGAYTIEIAGINGLGIIHTSAPIAVIIQYPWYNSLTARLVYGLLFLIVIGVSFRRYGNYKASRQQYVDKIRTNERENVRKKLAADFHDELGNRITRIGLHIKILQQGNEDKKEQILSKMEANTESLYAETRDFIWQMDPRKDSLYDTYGWLKKFGDEFFEDSSIDFESLPIQADAQNITLGMETRTHIVRIFKEAMNNAEKYSAAKKCLFSIDVKNKTIIVSLSDDGKGMDIEQALQAGNGLQNMQARAQQAGGELSFASQKGKGTSVTFTLLFQRLHA